MYALLDAEADPARTLFVRSNGWDDDGARRAGRTVVWIDGGGASPTTPPSDRVTALSEIMPIVPIVIDSRLAIQATLHPLSVQKAPLERPDGGRRRIPLTAGRAPCYASSQSRRSP